MKKCQSEQSYGAPVCHWPWVSTGPGPLKSSLTSVLPASEELTWHTVLILALAGNHISQLAYISSVSQPP